MKKCTMAAAVAAGIVTASLAVGAGPAAAAAPPASPARSESSAPGSINRDAVAWEPGNHGMVAQGVHPPDAVPLALQGLADHGFAIQGPVNSDLAAQGPYRSDSLFTASGPYSQDVAPHGPLGRD